jgi:hypothetical protein
MSMMTEKQKQTIRVSLLTKADALMGEALRLGGHHPCFAEKVIDAQFTIDDAIEWANIKWKKPKKRS